MPFSSHDAPRSHDAAVNGTLSRLEPHGTRSPGHRTVTADKDWLRGVVRSLCGDGCVIAGVREGETRTEAPRATTKHFIGCDAVTTAATAVTRL